MHNEPRVARNPADDLYLHNIRWRGREKLWVVRNVRDSMEALITPERVEVRAAPPPPYLAMPWSRVGQLAAAMAAWCRVRDSWPLYKVRFVHGLYAAPHCCYQPAGRAATERVVTWLSPDLKSAGEAQFRAQSTFMPQDVPVEIAPGIVRTALCWRQVPDVGPAEGEQVGEKWVLSGDYALSVERGRAALFCDTGAMLVNPEDASFFADLLLLKDAWWDRSWT